MPTPVHRPTAPRCDSAANRTSRQPWNLALRPAWLCPPGVQIPRSKARAGGLWWPMLHPHLAPGPCPMYAQTSGCHLPIFLTLRIDDCDMSCLVPVLPELTSPFRHCDLLCYLLPPAARDQVPAPVLLCPICLQSLSLEEPQVLMWIAARLRTSRWAQRTRPRPCASVG